MKKSRNLTSIKLPLIVLVFLIIVSGTMLSFSTNSFVFNIKEIGFTIFSTAQKGIVSVANYVGDFFNSIEDLAHLKEEHEILTKQLENYEFLQRTNAQIIQENERLNELFGFVKNYTYDTTGARIIGRDPESLYSSITIDKGSKNGIQKNMPVIAVQNGIVGVVGKVISVGQFTSMIMPLYDFNSHISARIQSTRDLGLASGNGSHLTLNYIKERALSDLQYGDVVVTSGENDNYMREIPIGTISSIETVDYNTSLIITLNPIIDFSLLEEVLVVNIGTLNQISATGEKE